MYRTARTSFKWCCLFFNIPQMENLFVNLVIFTAWRYMYSRRNVNTGAYDQPQSVLQFTLRLQHLP